MEQAIDSRSLTQHRWALPHRHVSSPLPAYTLSTISYQGPTGSPSLPSTGPAGSRNSPIKSDPSLQEETASGTRWPLLLAIVFSCLPDLCRVSIFFLSPREKNKGMLCFEGTKHPGEPTSTLPGFGFLSASWPLSLTFQMWPSLISTPAYSDLPGLCCCVLDLKCKGPFSLRPLMPYPMLPCKGRPKMVFKSQEWGRTIYWLRKTRLREEAQSLLWLAAGSSADPHPPTLLDSSCLAQCPGNPPSGEL